MKKTLDCLVDRHDVKDVGEILAGICFERALKDVSGNGSAWKSNGFALEVTVNSLYPTLERNTKNIWQLVSLASH